MCGFIAQLVEQCTGNAEVMGSNPVEALIFFSGFFFPIAQIGKFTAMIILHFHLQPQFKNELFHILHINQNECVHLWATMAQTWSHNTETNQMVSNGAQFFLECIMGWFLLLTHNKWGDFMPHVINWKFGGMLYIQGDSSRKEHDCNLFYSWKLFLRYKCEIFILGVLGFLKMTRSFPKILEEVWSLPKTSDVYRRRSYRKNAYPQNQSIAIYLFYTWF